jgi:DNA-binding HxlR family transcriptional regulator
MGHGPECPARAAGPSLDGSVALISRSPSAARAVIAIPDCRSREATVLDTIDRMRRSSFQEINCSIARSLEIIGEWWTLLVLRESFFGVTRFDEFQERLGIARNILTARLDTLVDAGVMERRVYDEARDRADYLLTKKGQALWSVLTAIRQWGDTWVMGKGHEPVVMVHTGCGARTRAVIVCGECGEPLQPRNIRLVDGPGTADASLLRRA